ncbi:hypothetical protein OJAV_G00083650 [Oryzias javanicus]|uniref:Uncharacterized protein n=1 Tax=Oryzias javanicus TaxID=123683 RepID=A0A437D5L5_ORYJA|nr:hypothetical protein OJAV_G00083650 [Oryzias javanicus]
MLTSVHPHSGGMERKREEEEEECSGRRRENGVFKTVNRSRAEKWGEELPSGRRFRCCSSGVLGGHESRRKQMKSAA